MARPRNELPHDLLAERSLLGCLLIDARSFSEITDINLKKDDFYHQQHAYVFEAIVHLASQNFQVEFVAVVNRLSDTGKIELIGDDEFKGSEFIANLIEEQATSANVYYYAKIVKEKAIFRDVIKLANRIVEKGIAYVGESKDFISDVESEIFKLTQQSRLGGMGRLSDFLKENLREMQNKSHKEGEVSGIPTGMTALDTLLLGMQAGQLIIVAARPGMGKTSFGLNIAINSVRATKLPVAIFSLEMMATELSMRILCSESKIDYKKIRKKSYNKEDLVNLSTAIQTLSSFPIYINDSGSVTLLDIQGECRKIKSENGIGLVLVDYVQLMRSHTNNPSREQQIAEISRGLKQLAKELECPVVALSQLNRAVEGRTEKRPNVSDLRESGALEQDADVVMLIYRDEVYYPDTKEKGIAEIIVGKNRAGESGTVKLAWVGSYTSFANLAREDERVSSPSPSGQGGGPRRFYDS